MACPILKPTTAIRREGVLTWSLWRGHRRQGRSQRMDPLWDFRRQANGHLAKLLKAPGVASVRDWAYNSSTAASVTSLQETSWGGRCRDLHALLNTTFLCYTTSLPLGGPITNGCLPVIPRTVLNTRLSWYPGEQVRYKRCSHSAPACSDRPEAKKWNQTRNIHPGPETPHTHNTHMSFTWNECERLEDTAVSRDGHRVEGPNRCQSQKILWLL